MHGYSQEVKGIGSGLTAATLLALVREQWTPCYSIKFIMLLPMGTKT